MTKTNKTADDFFDGRPKLEPWEIRAGIRRMSVEEAKKEEERVAKLESEMDAKSESARATNMMTATKFNNSIASAFKAFAWIVLVIGGIIVIANFSKLNTPAYSAEASVIVSSGLIVGIGGFLLLFAIGEVIQILHDIRRKLYEKD